MNKIQQINKNYYDTNAERWTNAKTNSFWHEEQFRKFITQFKDDDTILDVGCAYGIHVPLFLGIGRHLNYYGIDISDEFLKIARRRYPQLSFEYANVLDAETLPKQQFPGFWGAAIFMHIPEPDWPVWMKNIETIIEPGGVGYMTLPQQRPNPASGEDQRHFTYWNPEKLAAIIEPHGWKILAHGDMPDRAAQWQWYIVKLPS